MEINMTAQAAHSEFFNLHTNGIGYLNRIRWVETKGRGRRSDPFLACSISALRGSSDDVQYTLFDLRVSGKDAIELVESLQNEVNERRKVLVSFRIADIYPHTYERQVQDSQRRPTGQMEQAALIKGRLILINSVKVDGELVYTRPEDTSETDAEPQHEHEVGSFEDPQVNNALAAQQDQGYSPRPPAQRRPQTPAGYGPRSNHQSARPQMAHH
ncbi:DUF3577 domain-containing protein [Comamonas avium]|nr:DUF3577 domain-containing protein [Comamonas avium]